MYRYLRRRKSGYAAGESTMTLLSSGAGIGGAILLALWILGRYGPPFIGALVAVVSSKKHRRHAALEVSWLYRPAIFGGRTIAGYHAAQGTPPDEEAPGSAGST
jgi:hypothetical protein